MKRIHLLRGALVSGLSLMVVLLFCTTGSAFAEKPVYGYTTAEEQGFVIVLMDAPNDAGMAMFSYFPGVQVELLSDLKDGWLHVRVCNITGYMKANNVSFDPKYMEFSHELPIWTTKGKYSDSGTVNFRELPTFDIPPLSYFYVQDKKEIYVMGISEDWYHVNADGRMGFIRLDYLEDTKKMGAYVLGPFQSPMRNEVQKQSK